MILPDNFSDIIIPLTDKNTPFFVGNMTKSLFHKPKPCEALLGIKFRPGYSIAFVKDDMSKYSDNKVDLSLIIKKSFDEVIDKYFEKGQIIFNFLEDKIFDLFKKFKEYLGKTPKRFTQIERFNAFLKNPDENFYYDQSHLIKEFKILTGLTPNKILK